MSSLTPDTPRQSKAEQAFRRAFERLKNGTPLHTPKGTIVSQNNIARESGLDPSALKKSRYPGLVEEIQTWVQSSPQPLTAINTVHKNHRGRSRTLKEQLNAMKIQRDKALSLLADADMKILDMSHEIARLQRQLPSSNITSFPIGIKP